MAGKTMRQGEPADTSKWLPCRGCDRAIPVALEHDLDAAGSLVEDGSYTAVCPFCGHVALGKPRTWSADWMGQAACFGCNAPLSEGLPCGKCGLPRLWSWATCRECGARQAVEMPHLASECNLHVLECARCRRRSFSPCVC